MPDSNCLVAAVSEWHEHHSAADSEINRRRGEGQELVIAGHALVEAYAVLTRLPRLLRLSPELASRALLESFIPQDSQPISLSGRAYQRLIAQAPSDNVLGGRVYDALILACAMAAQVDVLLTFNGRHFRTLPSLGVEIVVPSG